MASSTLSTSTTVAFAPATGGDSGGGLSLTQGGEAVAPLGSVILTLTDTIPNGVPEIFTTVGETLIHSVGEVEEKEQFITLSGSTEYVLPSDTCSFDILICITEDGSRTTPQYSIQSGVVTFAEKVWGLFRVGKYLQTVTYLQYTPKTTGSSNQGTGMGTGVMGFLDEYGTVAAYKQGVVAVLDISPITSQGNGSEEVEIYRIESKVLINDKGAWEMPNGWPNSPTYGNGIAPPKPKIGVVTTRIHEIGFVSMLSGYIYTRQFNHSWNQPYFGSLSYKPKTELVHGNGLSNLQKANMSYYLQALEVIARRGLTSKAL